MFASLLIAGLWPAAGSPRGLDSLRPIAVVQPFRAADIVQPSDCREWAECRQLALDAAQRNDFETFHDLAWRAVQLGPKNDPALGFLLARAQSLSGRPHDALVMLRRLAPAGIAREAVSSPDFERVRALREWPGVAALLTGAPDAAESPRVETPEAPAKPAAIAPPPARDAPATSREVSAAAAGRKGRATAAAAEALRFAASSFKPATLAYDAVSRRFIISDTDVSRLAVIDEFSHQIATLASGQSAGFATITAVAIDSRAGDLWVASVDGSSGSDVPALHKLQLISGRVLKKFTSDTESTGPFVDLAIAADGTVYAVQEAGRIFRLEPGAKSLAMTALTTGGGAGSVTISTQGAVYIADAESVLRFRPSPPGHLKSREDLDLSGLVRIRWSRGSLVALQRTAEGSHRVIRIRLARDGRSVTRVDVLEASVSTPNPAAVTLAGDVFYYLAETNGAELAIRKIAIK